MKTKRKNRLTEAYESQNYMFGLKHPKIQYSANTVLCEFCGETKVPKKAHFRCYYCAKYTCFECAHYQAVFLSEPLKLHVQSMRVCPNCKIKTRLTSDLP